MIEHSKENTRKNTTERNNHVLASARIFTFLFKNKFATVDERIVVVYIIELYYYEIVNSDWTALSLASSQKKIKRLLLYDASSRAQENELAERMILMAKHRLDWHYYLSLLGYISYVYRVEFEFVETNNFVFRGEIHDAQSSDSLPQTLAADLIRPTSNEAFYLRPVRCSCKSDAVCRGNGTPQSERTRGIISS